MITTARKATAQIATDTADLLDLVIVGLFDEEFETCELGGCDAAELFERIDNRDGSTIRVCEYHADNGDVSNVDYDI